MAENEDRYQKVNPAGGWSHDVVMAATTYAALPSSYTLPPEVLEMVPSMVPPSSPEVREFILDNSLANWDGMAAKGMYRRDSHIRGGVRLSTSSSAEIIRDANRVTERSRTQAKKLSGRLTYVLHFDPEQMGAGSGAFRIPVLTAASLQSISDVFTEVSDELHHVTAALFAERIMNSQTPPHISHDGLTSKSGVPVVTTLVAPTFNSVKDNLPMETLRKLEDGNDWRALLRSVAQEAVTNFVAELLNTKTTIPFWSHAQPLVPESREAQRASAALTFVGTNAIRRAADRAAGGPIRSVRKPQKETGKPPRRRIRLPPDTAE